MKINLHCEMYHFWSASIEDYPTTLTSRCILYLVSRPRTIHAFTWLASPDAALIMVASMGF